MFYAFLFLHISDASKICYCWFVQFLFGCCKGSALCWVWLVFHIYSSSDDTDSQSDDVIFCLLIRGRASFTRKSCQTVLTAHLLYLVRAIAPIMPHLAEDIWQNLPFRYTLEDGSLAKFVFDLKWPEKNEEWLSVPKDDVDFLGVILEVCNFICTILVCSLLCPQWMEKRCYIVFSWKWCMLNGFSP